MLTPRQGCFLLALLLAGPSVSWAQAPATPAADHYNRAVDAINAGRWDEAVDALRQAVSADPQDADAHFQLGYAIGS
jgi:Flp pilus assembly protein TadD